MTESQGSTSNSRLRYAVDEMPSEGLTIGLSLQVVTLVLTGIILVPIIVLNAAGYPEGLAWAVFAALAVSGLTTILQARPAGPIGAGYPLYMGTSGAFIGVSAAAVAAGGLPLLGALVAASALVQFFFSARLSFFRRLITPTVGGTVIMLLAVNVFPITTDLLAGVPAGIDPLSMSGPLVAFATFATITLVSLYARGATRLWAPFIGILVGSAVAALAGVLDWSPLLDAGWFGLPQTGWPGLDLSLDARFFGLLVPFIIVTIIGAIETYGDAIAIQRVSHRTPVPVDFKVVQRALNADGVGNLLSGLAGTVPNTTYSSSISITDLTGVASRRVALYAGIVIVVAAFVPKIAALLQVVPDPVAGAYIFIFVVLLFRQGVRMVTMGGFDYEKGLIVCISFWVGLGFQFGVIFPDHLPAWSQGVFDNGMASGGIVAMTLTLLTSLRHRGQHEVLEPSVRSQQRLRAVLDTAAERAGWDEIAINRLELAGEEAFQYLLERRAESQPHPIRVAVRPIDDLLQIELVSGPDSANLEVRLGKLDDEHAEQAVVRDVGPRILRHVAKDVRHEQFYDLDVLTVTVDTRPLE
jgi:NCS2 family nucleobase:cation symporter-2/xanthine permease XanP